MDKLIVLAGDQNVGKTTTLRNLARSLLHFTNAPSTITTKINSFFLSQIANGKYLDLWLVIPTKDGYIYIATKGDDKKHTTANVHFFMQNYQAFHKLLPGAKIYTFDNNGCAIELKNLSDFVPLICISGSRLTKTVLQPLLDYAQTNSQLGEGIIINMRDNIPVQTRYVHYEQSIQKLI